MHWLRLHHDTPNDPKWRLVAVESGQTVASVQAVWMHMLVNASASSQRGTLEEWNDRIVGATLDIGGEAVAAIRAAMQGVVLDGDTLTGWHKRQRASDNVAERVKRHRDTKKTPPGGGNGGNASYGPNGTCNDTETLQTADVTLHVPDVTLPPLTRESLESKKEEESKGGSLGSVDSNPPHAGAREALPPTEHRNVVPIGKGQAVPLPDGWELPEEWRRWALNARWPDPDGSAEKFRNWFLGKWERGEKNATFTEAGWRRQWEEWINGDLKRERERVNGQGRHHHQQRPNGGLAAVVKSDLESWFRDPDDASDHG